MSNRNMTRDEAEKFMTDYKETRSRDAAKQQYQKVRECHQLSSDNHMYEPNNMDICIRYNGNVMCTDFILSDTLQEQVFKDCMK